MSLGGGLRLPFSDHVAATLGVRGYLTFVDSDTSFLCVSGSDESGCLVRSSGSTYFQAEAQLGSRCDSENRPRRRASEQHALDATLVHAPHVVDEQSAPRRCRAISTTT